MVKRAIAAMLSMVMILGVFSGLSISVQAANTKDVTLFSTGSTLASGITWTGTTQYSSNRGQLVHKNNGESATLTFSCKYDRIGENNNKCRLCIYRRVYC